MQNDGALTLVLSPYFKKPLQIACLWLIFCYFL